MLAGVVLTQCPGGGRREGTPDLCLSALPPDCREPCSEVPRGPEGLLVSRGPLPSSWAQRACPVSPRPAAQLDSAPRGPGAPAPSLPHATHAQQRVGRARGLTDAGYEEEQGESGLPRLKSGTRTQLPLFPKGSLALTAGTWSPWLPAGREGRRVLPDTEGEGPGRAGRPVCSYPVWPTWLGPAPQRGRTQVSM